MNLSQLKMLTLLALLLSIVCVSIGGIMLYSIEQEIDVITITKDTCNTINSNDTTCTIDTNGMIELHKHHN